MRYCVLISIQASSKAVLLFGAATSNLLRFSTYPIHAQCGLNLTNEGIKIEHLKVSRVSRGRLACRNKPSLPANIIANGKVSPLYKLDLLSLKVGNVNRLTRCHGASFLIIHLWPGEKQQSMPLCINNNCTLDRRLHQIQCTQCVE